MEFQFDLTKDLLTYLVWLDDKLTGTPSIITKDLKDYCKDTVPNHNEKLDCIKKFCIKEPISKLTKYSELAKKWDEANFLNKISLLEQRVFLLNINYEDKAIDLLKDVEEMGWDIDNERVQKFN